jgi:ferrous iron transport protein A
MDMTHATGSLRSPELPARADTVAAAAVAAPGAAAAGVAAAAAGMKLADLATGAEARVVSVSAVDSGASVELGRRLAELGFLPGEKLRIVARGFLGREPIAVRIGTGTFALRLFEAACIRVRPEQPQRR